MTAIKNKAPKRQEIRVVDVPQDLYKKIKKEADVNERTINKEVLFLLKKTYA